jgi:predicted amidophosphoribosyltransferase
LCERCAQFVDVLTPPICERCGAPGIGPTCCRNLEGFRRARSVVAFVEPARALTLALKRRGRRPLAYALGDLLAALADKHDLRADSVTFVPAGRTAGRRGFDHAELIARAAASSLGLPARALLVRTEDGPRQADVAFAERRSNVRNRFAAEAARGRLLVVDDVFTTGATAEACSLALRAAGAETVDVVTWARTLRRRF